MSGNVTPINFWDELLAGRVSPKDVSLAEFLEQSLFRMMTDEKYEINEVIPHGGGEYGVSVSVGWVHIAEQAKNTMRVRH